ncbi:HD-GYP domain-containing protein [Acetivibrio cellulolyticus]|uniref:HD-GYP domain-containing protein n=1 Tax=Acetivibrio cellulolyticus TaxID=35830 RepID=UPI0001E2E698|nr:HD domain-containing phosphohydrolase [Acetivibrio cellulolyticus]
MIKLEIFQLLEGMITAEPIKCPNTGSILLNSGSKLTTAIIESLKSRKIQIVSITDQYTLFVDPVDTMTKELGRLLEDGILKMAPDIPEANKSDKMVSVSKLARKIAKRIIENRNIVQYCVVMKLLDDCFLFKHAVNTCIISLLVAGAMDMVEATVEQVGTGALLHDIGLCEMPLVINTKQRNSQQESLWREHPTYGYYFAKEIGLSEEVAEIILNHHENWSGNGYPKGLSSQDIPIGARIVSICENYDRLLYHEGYPHYKALEYLLDERNKIFDGHIVQVFTNSLAVYPLGSMVRLSTGEVGVVVNVRKNLGPRPVVRIYYNRVNRPLTTPYDLDLDIKRNILIDKVL